METIYPFALPPELRAPVPRPARLPLGTQTLLAVAALLLLLLVVGGGRVLWEATRMAHLNARGRTVSARIVNVKTLPVAGPGQPAVTEIRYQYQWPFAPGGQRGGVGQSPRGGFAVGGTLPVRCDVWLGAELASPGGRIPPAKIGFLALCALVLVGMGAGLLARLAQWRTRRLHLLKHGMAAVGTVTLRRTEAHDTPRYFVRFGYAAQGVPVEREEQVTADVWKRVEIGQPIAVLFDPAQPAEGTLYGA